MKKCFVASLLLFGLANVFAQKTITVTSKDYVIEKITRKGLSTTIELDAKFIKDNWKDYIKEFGKVESKGDTYTIPIANISSVSSSPCKMYSSVESSGKGTVVWIGIDLGDKIVTEGGEGYNAVQKLLKDFAISCYKKDIEDQIKEAEKALDSSTKKDEKVIKEGEKLVSDKENNASEKIKLEEALKKNASDKVQVEKDIEQNKKDQSASKEEVAKMKKALEIKQSEYSQLK